MTQGRFLARFAADEDDIARAQRLRHAAFGAGTAAARPDGRDADAHDALCRHVLVEDAAGTLACTFRLLPLCADGLQYSYAARHYCLDALATFPGPMLELGRFCLRPGAADPAILRTAWGAIARIVDREGVRLIFGCTSFRGTDPTPYTEAFALLAHHHLAPHRWRPRPLAPKIIRFARRPHDADRAHAAMPPLLRFYLALGGRVSDHAVIDQNLGTLHVFTAVETARIPAARARFLRAGMP